MATAKTTKPKAETTKKTASKAPAKKAALTKKTPVKKAAAKSTGKTRNISAEERYRMIEVAAYYIAERNSFEGSSTDYWIAAEAEIAKVIGK